jgi:hypothetical protein
MGEPMDRSKRVFGDLAPFEKVFPTIDVATISSWKDGEGYTRSALTNRLAGVLAQECHSSMD